MEGRWPANVILSPAMAGSLDEQSGTLKSGTRKPSTRAPLHQHALNRSLVTFNTFEGDEGGASRFFLNAGYEPWELDWIYANGLRPCE